MTGPPLVSLVWNTPAAYLSQQMTSLAGSLAIIAPAPDDDDDEASP
jgi:hypothetical protein